MKRKKKKIPKRQAPKKRRNSTKKLKAAPRGNSKQNLTDSGFALTQYELTDEPLDSPYLKKLPPAIRERVDDLYHLSLTKPKQVIAEILDLVKKYPEVPMFYNYLSVAYSQLGDFENRNATILECYKKFPKYLFGRVNYAQVCLENGDAEKIPEIFEGKLDLKLLYPKRTKFHISEYINFTGVLGLYNLSIGRREIATQYYETMKQMDPRHRATKRLKRDLNPPLIARLLFWIFRKATGSELTPEALKTHTRH